MNNRRNFLKLAGLSGLTVLTTMKGAEAAIDACDFKPTPKQPLGPFYPVQFPQDSNVDLTRLGNSQRQAKGELIIVGGVITDDMCRPIPGAIVEIWQACHTGKYNHPSDTSQTPLDPDFQYYGVMKTNERGEYIFKTILPGSYLASANWRRPPHIHYKVSLRGYRELVTQLYFAGNTLNQQDQILMSLPLAEQRKLIVPFAPTQINGQKVMQGRFDLTLNRI